MNKTSIIVLTLLLLGLIGCGQSRKTDNERAMVTTSYCFTVGAPWWNWVKQDEGNLEPIPHRWADLDTSVCQANGISNEDIEQWKLFFTKRYIFDMRSFFNIQFFNNENQYLTIEDLQNIFFDESDDPITKTPCILWRMLQYCACDGITIPESRNRLTRLMRQQIDSVLSYIPPGNCTAGNRAALKEYLIGWYYDMLSTQIQGVLSDDLKILLKMEDIAWRNYHKKSEATYLATTENRGSGSWVFDHQFSMSDLTMRQIGVEAFYKAVFPDANLCNSEKIKQCAIVSEEDVLLGYSVFPYPNVIEEEYYEYQTLEFMEACLAAEETCWNEWMTIRSEISAKLSGNEKDAWDKASNVIRSFKVKQLKNDYTNTPAYTL